MSWPAVTGETLIFTAYVVDGYNNTLSSSANGDADATYAGGVRYNKTGTSDADMNNWSGWNTHPWDSWFWLQGYLQ